MASRNQQTPVNLIERGSVIRRRSQVMLGDGLEIPGDERKPGLKFGTQQTAQPLPKHWIRRHASQGIPLQRFGAGRSDTQARDCMPCLHEQTPVCVGQGPGGQANPLQLLDTPAPCNERTQFILGAQDALERDRRIAAHGGEAN